MTIASALLLKVEVVLNFRLKTTKVVGFELQSFRVCTKTITLPTLFFYEQICISSSQHNC